MTISSSRRLAVAFVLLFLVPAIAQAQGTAVTTASPEEKCQPSDTPPSTPAAIRARLVCDDQREDVDVSLFTGVSIDSFAATDLKKYLNPSASGDVQEQLIAGFDFSLRLAGSRGTRQLWLYGETVHGVRSGDVDCTKDPKSKACEVAKLEPENPDPQAAFAIFRKATSFEGFFGLRYEFLRLKTGSNTAAGSVYVKAQAGFLTVANNGADVVDIHHVGLGVNVTTGPLRDSYVEVGFGKNDIFSDGRKRAKIDALLSLDIGKDIRPFAQLVIDADLRDGPDSIRSYFGFDIDVKALFKKKPTAPAGGGS